MVREYSVSRVLLDYTVLYTDTNPKISLVLSICLDILVKSQNQLLIELLIRNVIMQT